MSPQTVSESDGSAGWRMTVDELLDRSDEIGPGAHELLTVICRALDASDGHVSLVKGTLHALLSGRAVPLDVDCHLLAALMDETLGPAKAEACDDD